MTRTPAWIAEPPAWTYTPRSFRDGSTYSAMPAGRIVKLDTRQLAEHLDGHYEHRAALTRELRARGRRSLSAVIEHCPQRPSLDIRDRPANWPVCLPEDPVSLRIGVLADARLTLPARLCNLPPVTVLTRRVGPAH